MADGYPDNWDQIAKEVKGRANWRCEHCGHPHDRQSGHVLTVHHLDGNPPNCAHENLVALCQRCHLHIQAKWRPGDVIPAAWGRVPGWITRRGLDYRLDSLQMRMF